MVSVPSERSAGLREQLTGALIGLARATEGNEHLISSTSTAVVVEGLYAAIPNGVYEDAALKRLLERVEEEKRKMVPNCFECASPCGRTSGYNMAKLWDEEEEIRALKEKLLHTLRETAACIFRGAVPENPREKAEKDLYKGLIAIGIEGFAVPDLQLILREMDQLKKSVC